MRLLLLVCTIPMLACGGATTSSSSGDASADALGDDIAEAGQDGARLSDGGDWIGRDASPDASRPIACGTTTCSGDRVCVVTTAGGGPCIQPVDGGLCPNGTPWNGGCCDNTTTTYACEPLPASCGGALACPCASALCQCGGCEIADAGVLACKCFYP